MVKKAKAKSKEQKPLFSSQPPNPAFDRTRVTLWLHCSDSVGAGRSTRALGVAGAHPGGRRCTRVLGG